MNYMEASLIFSKSAKNTNLQPRMFKYFLPFPVDAGCWAMSGLRGHPKAWARVEGLAPRCKDLQTGLSK